MTDRGGDESGYEFLEPIREILAYVLGF